MTLNRRRTALAAIIVAAVVGWAGAGVASASGDATDSNKWDSISDSNKWDGVSDSNKWD
ncbi:MAG TPA: hypothetical protein VFZ72_19040 [Jiangellaceae bacterium]